MPNPLLDHQHPVGDPDRSGDELPVALRRRVSLHLLELPALAPGSDRRLVVEALDAVTRETLEQRGYRVLDLFSLPRGTASSDQEYLLARAQGMTEGTVPSGQREIRSLELEMRAHGMLDRQSRSMNFDVKVNPDQIADLLNWGADRHTLAQNSTVVSAKSVDDAGKAIPKEKD